MEDPLYGASKHHDTLHVEAPPQALADRLEELRQRVGDSYRGQLELKLRAVLRQCAAWGVRVVVFPEYSIPWQLLEVLAREAGPMLVVAGTHVVDRAARKRDPYHQLGYPKRPGLAQAVCPVLYGGKLIALQPKLGFTLEEKELGLKKGDVFQSVPTPEDVPGEMAVLICRDFLDRETESHRQLVGGPLDRCRFVATPSYTPITSLPEFTAKAMESARRYGKPVLYANVTRPGRGRDGGGTTVYGDRIPPHEPRDFPAQVGWLEPDDEGVIVADIDLSPVPPGPSTRYSDDLQVRSVAAASFVYPTDAKDAPYAKWMEEIAPLLERTDDDAVEVLSEAIQSADALLRGFASASTARGRRLMYLLREHGRMQEVESFRRCLRELVLPQDALPLPALRSAMARGAAEAIKGWQLEFPKVELAAVLQTLEQAAKDPAALVPLGTITSDAIAKAVRGGVRSVQEKLEFFRQALVTDLEMGDEHGATRFEAEDYKGALETFGTALTKAKQGADAASEDKRLRRQVASLRLRIANCHIHLNDDVGARAALAELGVEEQALLLPKDRETYLILTAQMGEVARARELLDAGAEVANPERLRTILALLGGEIPDAPPSDPTMRELAAQVLARKGRAATAVSWAMSAHQEKPRKIIGRLGLTELLVNALTATIYEDPELVEPVSVGERAAVLEQIETGISEILEHGATWPDSLRETGHQIAMNFFKSTIDGERALELAKNTGLELPPEERDLLSKADSGLVDEAEARVPSDGAPWNRELSRVRIRWHAKRFDEAIEQARVLAKRYPERAPIELNLAYLLLARGHSAEALVHAEVAYKLLPARSARVALGVACVANNEMSRGWTLLAPLTDTKSADVLWARAIAAEHAEPAHARAAWERYFAAKPDDLSNRLRLMRLSALTAPSETADEAWALFEGEKRDSLSPNELYMIAQLQPVDGPRGEERQKRIMKVAKDLDDRFSGDARAVALRLMLLAKLDFPEGSSPIDFGLLEKEGVAWKASLEEVREQWKEGIETQRNAQELYWRGLIPIEFLLKSQRISAAYLLTELIERNNRAYLSTRMRLVDPPVPLLAGKEVLVGEIELLLLRHLDLWEPIRQALGAKGALLVFKDAFEQFYESLEDLESRRKPIAREKSEAFSRRIEELSLSGRLDRSKKTQRELALEDDSVLISQPESTTDVRRLSPWRVIDRLFQKRLIDRSMRERLEKVFPRKEEADAAEVEARNWVVDWVTLKEFFEARALDALLKLAPGPLRVGLEFTAMLTEKQHGHRIVEQAALQVAALVRELQRGREEGWVKVIERPAVAQRLPPLRTNEEESKAVVLRDMVCSALAYKEALVDHPSRLLLTTDLIVAALFSQDTRVDILKVFRWTEDHYRALKRRYLALEEQVISFAQLAPVLATGEREHTIRIALVEFGVRDALAPTTLVHLADRYDGIETGVPERLLNIVEAPAGNVEHPTNIAARVRIGSLYASTIWEAYSSSEQKLDDQKLEPRTAAVSSERSFKIDAEALTVALLNRAEQLDKHLVASVVDHLLMYLYGLAVSRPKAAFAPRTGKHFLSHESPLGRLLHAVIAWAMVRPSRRAAMGRAFRATLVVLDEARRGAPPRLHEIPLLLAYGMASEADTQSEGRKTQDTPLALTSPEQEALAIASADWPGSDEEGPELGIGKDGISYGAATDEKPFRMNFEEILRSAGTLIGKGEAELFGTEALVDAPFALQGISEFSRIVVAPEALLLRIDHTQYPEACRDFANYLASFAGPHDGRLHDVLRDFAEEPGQSKLRRDLVRCALTVPWRAVREDPLLILRWGHSFRDGPRDMSELCLILSEPEQLPEGEPRQMLFSRVEEGGLWRDRRDLLQLALQASEIPGTVSPMFVSTLLQLENLGNEIGAALERLSSPDDQPVARLARDIVLLRAAAARQQHVRIPARKASVDLRERLPALLARVLESVKSGPTKATLASYEAGLLRLCQRIVGKLAEHQQRDERHELWMTWRFYQWYVAQLERQHESLRPWTRKDRAQTASEPELAGRIDASVWERLEKHFPAPVAVEQINPRGADLLDPRFFSQQLFRHRLATVLHAFLVAEVAAQSVGEGESEDTSTQTPFTSGEALIKPLLELAAKPLTEFERGWVHRGRHGSTLGWDAAVALPDLALELLLLSDSSTFIRLAPNVRLRWFERLPKKGDDTQGLIDSLVVDLLAAAVEHGGKLSADELAILRERARHLIRTPKFFPQAYALLARLQKPDGHEDMEKLREFLLNHLDHPQAALLFGEYLMAVSKTNLSQLTTAVDSVFAAVVQHGGNTVQFAMGLGRVAYLGDPDGQRVARETLAHLGASSPYREDTEFRQLLQLLGVEAR